MRNQILLLIFGFTYFSACQQPTSQPIMKHYTSESMAAMDLPFSEAVIVDNMIYLSGQIGNVPGKMEMVPGGIEAETRQAMDKIQSVLKANGTSLDNAVKLTIMMADMSEWGRMNEVYKTYFPGKRPARSAFGTSGLALGARLEIECIAVIDPKRE